MSILIDNKGFYNNDLLMKSVSVKVTKLLKDLSPVLPINKDDFNFLLGSISQIRMKLNGEPFSSCDDEDISPLDDLYNDLFDDMERRFHKVAKTFHETGDMLNSFEEHVHARSSNYGDLQGRA